MRRVLLLAALLLAVDQATKTLAQLALPGEELTVAGRWGVTYVVNQGLWLWPEAPLSALVIVHGLAIGLWVGLLVVWRWYVRWYRPSLAVDLAVAALTVSAFGNLIDRLLVGGARDWWMTPIAIANLADTIHWLAIALLLWELWRFAPARHLVSLRVDPRRGVPPPGRRPGGTPPGHTSSGGTLADPTRARQWPKMSS